MLQEANKYRYEYMRLKDIRKTLSECPVAIVPSGLLEWHGEQNAVGLDALKGYYICERVMILLGGGALLPINWVGTYGYIRYEGTVCYDQETTYQVFLQLYKELAKVGFKVILVLTGHYGHWQMTMVRKARDDAKAYFAKHGIDATPMAENPPHFLLGYSVGGHAGYGETSMLMRAGEAWGVDLVDTTDFNPEKAQPPWYNLPEEEEKNIPIREPDEWVWKHDLSNPKLCSPEIGEKLIQKITAGMILEIVEALDELNIPFSPSVSVDSIEEMAFETLDIDPSLVK